MSENTEPVISKSKKKTWIVIAIAAVVVLALVIIIIKVLSKSPERRIQEQLDLGYKYLSELDYEQAVACFEAIIEIDPRNTDAYMGIVDAYRQSGDDEAALAAAERAYEATGESAFRDIIDELTPDVPEPEPVAEPIDDTQPEDPAIEGLSGDPNEVVVDEYYAGATLTIYGDGRVRITLTDVSIHVTYTVGKGTVEDNYMEYGWVVEATDGTNTFEVAVQSWMWEGRQPEQTSLVDGMQHSLWYDGTNMLNMDVVLDGHTIIWDFYIPERGLEDYNSDIIIPQFDLRNTHISSVFITLDGEDYYY